MMATAYSPERFQDRCHMSWFCHLQTINRLQTYTLDEPLNSRLLVIDKMKILMLRSARPELVIIQCPEPGNPCESFGEEVWAEATLQYCGCGNTQCECCILHLLKKARLGNVFNKRLPEVGRNSHYIPTAVNKSNALTK